MTLSAVVAPRASLAILRRRSSITTAATTTSTTDAHHVEALGLFLYSVLSPSDAGVDLVHAIERMAQDGVEPPLYVLDALRVHANEAVATRLVAHCSPSRLCVLRDTLQYLTHRSPTQVTLAPLDEASDCSLARAVAATSDVALPSPPTLSYYSLLLQQLETALRSATTADSREDVLLAFHGDAETLRPRVMAELTAARHCQRAARLLLSTPSLESSLSLRCVEQLREMAASGKCVSPDIADELQTAQGAALAAVVQRMSDAAIHALMIEMSQAAMASRESDVLMLWAALHTAATVCERQRSAKPGTRPTIDEEADETAPDIDEIEIAIDQNLDQDATQTLRNKHEHARQFALTIQRLLMSLTGLAFSARMLKELRATARDGHAALSRDTLDELTVHWDAVLQRMPLETIHATTQQLERLAEDQEVGNDDWRVLLQRTQQVAADHARTAEPLSAQAVDFYTLNRLSAQRVVRGLEASVIAHRCEAKAAADEWRLANATQIEAAYDQAALGVLTDASHTNTKSFWRTLKSKMPSLSKFEILRDFAQVMSLVFTNLFTVALEQAPETITSLQEQLNHIQMYLRGLANFFAADYTGILLRYTGAYVEIVPDVLFAGLIACILVACVGLVVLAVAVAWRLDTHDPTEAKTFKQKNLKLSMAQRLTAWVRETLSIRTVTIVLTLCQSVHLPVARLSMEILTGSKETSSVHRRYRDMWFWTYLHEAAILLLIGYVGGLIVLLFTLIHRNAPRVTERPRSQISQTSQKSQISQPTWLRQTWTRMTTSHHLTIVDLDGTPVDFRNSVYAEILARDPTQLRCPYRSLYAGFERRWRFYKVVQLSIKVVLSMLLIWIRDPRVRALTTLGVTTLSFVSTWTAPFIDDFDDQMELSAKWTAFVTCVGGVTLAYDPQSASHVTQGVSMAVTIVNLGNAVFLVGITLLGSDSVSAWLRAQRTTLTFSDSRRYAVHKRPHKVLPHWHVDHEIRHRVWHAFWKRTLLATGEYAAIQRLAHAKVEEEQAAKAAATHHKQKETAALAQRRHWLGQADERTAAVRTLVQSMLEGPDVFYESPTTKTHCGFGRLTVVSYPFHCEFQYDDAPHTKTKVGIVEDTDVATLLVTNFRCDVARRRLVRQQLRALSAWAKPIDLRFERDEVWTGREPLSFRCQYTRGVVHADASSATGFHLSIAFRDGTGEVLCPETKEVLYCAINRQAVVEGDAALALLGLSRTFDASPTLQEILSRIDVAAALSQYLPHVYESQRDVRERHLLHHHEREAVLSSGFRFVVYNNPHISRRELDKYLLGIEANASLQKLPTTRRAALDLLYEKLRFIKADFRVAFWYLFWHDVYEQNGRDMRILKANRLALDPDEPTSIAYDVLPREALQRWLQRRGLWGERKLFGVRWRKRLFHTELLDLLYECMDKQVAGTPVR